MVCRVSFSFSWQKHFNELLGEVRMGVLSLWTRQQNIKTAREKRCMPSVV